MYMFMFGKFGNVSWESWSSIEISIYFEKDWLLEYVKYHELEQWFRYIK